MSIYTVYECDRCKLRFERTYKERTEGVPSDWSFHSEFGNLCGKCTITWEKCKTDFLAGAPK